MRSPPASAEITQVIFHLAESLRTAAHGVRRLMAMALCRLTMMARETSSRTATREMRKKSWRCLTSPPTGSNSPAGVPNASAVTAWQAGGCTFAHGEQELHPSSIPERIVDVPVLQITDELLNEADAAVRCQGREAGGRRRRLRRWRCSSGPDAAPWQRQEVR